MEKKQIILCFKALSDETRLQIIDMLKEGRICACKILENLNITQPTLSYHMAILVDSGLVNMEKVGTWNHYFLSNDTFEELKRYLSF